LEILIAEKESRFREVLLLIERFREKRFYAQTSKGFQLTIKMCRESDSQNKPGVVII
jgi:hypothetical protein